MVTVSLATRSLLAPIIPPPLLYIQYQFQLCELFLLVNNVYNNLCWRVRVRRLASRNVYKSCTPRTRYMMFIIFTRAIWTHHPRNMPNVNKFFLTLYANHNSISRGKAISLNLFLHLFFSSNACIDASCTGGNEYINPINAVTSTSLINCFSFLSNIVSPILHK